MWDADPLKLLKINFYGHFRIQDEKLYQKVHRPVKKYKTFAILGSLLLLHSLKVWLFFVIPTVTYIIILYTLLNVISYMIA